MEQRSLPIIHKVTIYLILLQTLLFKWLLNKDISPYISLLLFIIILILTIRKKILKNGDFIVFFLFGIVIIINLLANGIKTRFFGSLYSEGIANLIIIIYILFIKSIYTERLKNFILNDLFAFLNIYFFINIPILINQLNNSYFMMRYIQNNHMYADHITGLIGASGTHNLLMFWILLAIVNLFKIYQYNKIKDKVLVVFEIIFMVFISNKNDNTAFYILFTIVFFQYILKEILKFRVKNVIKVVVSVLAVTIMIITIYNNNESFREFYDTRIYSKLTAYGVINDESKSYNAQGDERIMLYNMALEYGNGYGLGKGIGSIRSYGEPSLHMHFGMSEISLRVYEGGIIYLASLILIFTYFLYRICSFNKIVFRITGFTILFLNVLLFSIYTTVFRNSIFPIVLSLIACMISYKYVEKSDKFFNY